jgi:hypothetical protein
MVADYLRQGIEEARAIVQRRRSAIMGNPCLVGYLSILPIQLR